MPSLHAIIVQIMRYLGRRSRDVTTSRFRGKRSSSSFYSTLYMINLMYRVCNIICTVTFGHLNKTTMADKGEYSSQIMDIAGTNQHSTQLFSPSVADIRYM